MNIFTHKLFSASLCALMALPATAQLQQRNTTPAKVQQKASIFSTENVNSSRMQLLSAVAKADAVRPYSEYGTVVDIASEDFSKLTTGTPGNPDTNTELTWNNPDNVWITMLDQYTQTPGWGCRGAYSAGGELYIEAGSVNTPMLDVSGYSGICMIQFDCYAASSTVEATSVGIEAAETNGMGPTWDMLGSNILPAVNNEKKTYTYMFYGGGKTTIFNIYNYSNTAILVDNIHVYQIDQTVGTPSEARHRYYHGEDFNLVWNKAKNAESYLIDMYTLNDAGAIDDYLLHDFDTESSDTTYTVENAVSGQTYYYTIRGKKGDNTSIASEQFEVYDVATPVLNDVEASSITEGKYTATWDAVPSAERYNYTALYKRTAAEDGTFNLTNLVFPGMKYNEGSLDSDGNQLVPTYTVKDPDTHSLDLGVLQDADQAGWTARHYAVYKDALAIDGFFYYYSKETCSLESPEFDLSKNNGQFTVNTRLCSENVLWYDDNGNSFNVNPRSMIALFTYDDELDDFVQTESWYVSDLTNDWKDYTHTFTKGTDRSILSAFAVYAPGNLYIENLKIDQDYKAGDTFLDPFYSANFVDSTAIDVPVWKDSEKLNGADIYHQIQSVRTPTEQDQYASSYKRVYSDWSEPTLVTANINGIGKVSLNSTSHATVMVKDNNLVVNNPKGEAVNVYGVNGVQVFSNASGAATVNVPMPQRGTYIIKVGKQSIKFVL